MGVGYCTSVKVQDALAHYCSHPHWHHCVTPDLPLPGWWEGITPVSEHPPSTSCLAHFRATVCKQHAGYYGGVGDEDRGGGPSL